MTVQSPAVNHCVGCGTQLAPAMNACPTCGRLVYSQQLEQLARIAGDAKDHGDISGALTAWREALPLLPVGSRQYQIISQKITDLGRQIPNAPPPAGAQPGSNKSSGSKVAAGVGAIGLTLWKFKVLLLGLTKGTTFFSMLLSIGVYCTIFGWKFAIGLVLSIYVHEMGHVIALRRYGFKATSPMFIPGIGALIRLQQQVVNPLEDADIGLAGPIYGLGAALVSLGIWAVTHQPIFAAIAGVGAWINLFNLVPIGSLDGGRGFHAMSRAQKFIAAVTVGGCAYYAADGLLMVIAIVCFGRAFSDNSNVEGSRKTVLTYVGLVVILTAVSLVRHVAGVQ